MLLCLSATFAFSSTNYKVVKKGDICAQTKENLNLAVKYLATDKLPAFKQMVTAGTIGILPVDIVVLVVERGFLSSKVMIVQTNDVIWVSSESLKEYKR